MQLLVFAVLTMIGAIIGAALGKYCTADWLEYYCQELHIAEACGFYTSRTFAFCVELVTAVFALICIIVMIVAFCKEEVIRPCKILTRVLFTISTVLEICALIIGPASFGTDFFDPRLQDFEYQPEPGVEDLPEYKQFQQCIRPDTLQQQWYATLISAVFSLTTMLVSYICGPKE